MACAVQSAQGENNKTRSENGTRKPRGFFRPRCPISGFTLIEVMVAVTIFGIISIAVYSTFRAGLKSYESGRDQMTLTQTSRAVFDLLTRDLRNLYYQPPAVYNRGLISRLQFRMMDSAMQAAQQALHRGVNRGGKEEKQEEEPSLGLPINLTIVAEDHEGGDSLTFVTHQPHSGMEPTQLWALARVKYFVEDEVLFRSEGPVTVERVPSFQWQAPTLPGQPSYQAEDGEAASSSASNSVEDYLRDAPREMVARDVKTFDLRYGYWTPESWYESPSWIAHERQFRNPPLPVDPLNPMAVLIAQRNLHRPTDDVPAYVVVTLALAHGKDRSRQQVFRTRIRLFASSETYEPLVDPTFGARGIAPGASAPPPPPASPPGMPTPPGTPTP